MDASLLITLINLFLVPLVPVYFYYKKNAKPLKPGVELLFHYGMATVFLVPATKAVALLPGKILSKYIDADSGYYTLAALIAALLLFFLAGFIKVEFVNDETSSNDEDSE